MPETHGPRSLDVAGFAAIAACTAILGAVVGCGSSDTGGGTSLGAAHSSASSIAAAGEESDAPIDVCALLSPTDVSALLGTTVDGSPSDSACVWENPDNLESVSVEIGS